MNHERSHVFRRLFESKPIRHRNWACHSPVAVVPFRWWCKQNRLTTILANPQKDRNVGHSWKYQVNMSTVYIYIYELNININIYISSSKQSCSIFLQVTTVASKGLLAGIWHPQIRMRGWIITLGAAVFIPFSQCWSRCLWPAGWSQLVPCEAQGMVSSSWKGCCRTRRAPTVSRLASRILSNA
jgi:hypothetical protein